MRINPIMAHSRNLMTKKISFGMIDSKKTENLTWDTMMEELDWMDEEDRKDPSFHYEEQVEDLKKQLEYFKASRLFTLKSKKNTDNENVLYVTMNQEEVDKHEHKEFFDKMIDFYKKLYDPKNEKHSLGCVEEAQKAGLPGEEKGFLDIFEEYRDIKLFYDKMQNNEKGIIPPPPEPMPPSTNSIADSIDTRPLFVRDPEAYMFECLKY